MDKENLADRLLEAIDNKKNPSVVGLDPRINRIPDHIKEEAVDRAESPFEAVRYAFEEFNKSIIDEIEDIVPAVKPQVAFYEQYGGHGLRAFEETIDYAKDKGLIVISDVKRNDIGSTAKAYAAAHLGEVERINKDFTYSFDSDMVTVNAYLGTDGVEPFLDVCKKYAKGIFILVKTSNPSSGELQDKEIKGEGKVYELMGELVKKWGDDLVGHKGYSSVGAVVGATYPEEAEKLREMMKKAIFLVPGYGAQGGTADDIIPCFNDDGYGGIVNSSRGIIFAYEKEPYSEKFGENNFAKASRQAVLDMKNDIRRSLEKGKKVPEGW
ncbi:MAG: orotidine-5'-phosphate decarboxylase [Candidatus Saliniplasma sp.]